MKGEISLSEQDVELLITALEVLLQRTQNRGDSTVLQSSIYSMRKYLIELRGEGRTQAIAAIQKALSEIAAELESNSLDTAKSD